MTDDTSDTSSNITAEPARKPSRNAGGDRAVAEIDGDGAVQRRRIKLQRRAPTYEAPLVPRTPSAELRGQRIRSWKQAAAIEHARRKEYAERHADNVVTRKREEIAIPDPANAAMIEAMWRRQAYLDGYKQAPAHVGRILRGPAIGG